MRTSTVRHVTFLSVARGLRQLAETSAADLLVVGSNSRGSLGRWFLGDDTRAALSGAACSVAVAPGGYAERPGPISRIGVAYNGTPESETALAVARGLAARCGASVRALLVVSPVPRGVGYWETFEPDPGAGVAEVMQAARDRLRLLDDVDGRIAVGVPSEALVASERKSTCSWSAAQLWTGSANDARQYVAAVGARRPLSAAGAAACPVGPPRAERGWFAAGRSNRLRTPGG